MTFPLKKIFGNSHRINILKLYQKMGKTNERLYRSVLYVRQGKTTAASHLPDVFSKDTRYEKYHHLTIVKDQKRINERQHKNTT